MKGKTVEQSDLVGALKEFPIEVVQEMVNEQVRQGNNSDVGVFKEDAGKDKRRGGFDWIDSVMGDYFWKSVLAFRDFNLFFQKYPKNKNKYIPKIMEESENRYVAYDAASGDHEEFKTLKEAEDWLTDGDGEGISEEACNGQNYIAEIQYRSTVTTTDRKEDYHVHILMNARRIVMKKNGHIPMILIG